MTVKLVDTPKSLFAHPFHSNSLWSPQNKNTAVCFGLICTTKFSMIKMCQKKKEGKKTNPDSIAVIRSTVRSCILQQENR